MCPFDDHFFKNICRILSFLNWKNNVKMLLTLQNVILFYDGKGSKQDKVDKKKVENMWIKIQGAWYIRCWV